MLVTETIGIVAATPLIADAAPGTFRAGALVEAGLVAGVWCEGGGVFVCFPDVHFIATGPFALDIALVLLTVPVFQEKVNWESLRRR